MVILTLLPTYPFGQYTLTHLMPELLAVVINIIVDIPYGMSSLMILSIDLFTEVNNKLPSSSSSSLSHYLLPPAVQNPSHIALPSLSPPPRWLLPFLMLGSLQRAM